MFKNFNHNFLATLTKVLKQTENEFAKKVSELAKDDFETLEDTDLIELLDM